MIGIDSSILIDILRNPDKAHILDQYQGEELCTSEIVVYEILYGVYASQHASIRRIEQFEAVLGTFAHVFPVDGRASRRAAQIAGHLARKGQMIEHRDALIAGCLLAHGCSQFLTKNRKDFDKISGLHVLP